MKRIPIPGDGLLSDGARTFLALGEWALERVVDTARHASGRCVAPPRRGAPASDGSAPSRPRW